MKHTTNKFNFLNLDKISNSNNNHHNRQPSSIYSSTIMGNANNVNNVNVSGSVSSSQMNSHRQFQGSVAGI